MTLKFVTPQEFERIQEIATYCFPWMHNVKDAIRKYINNYINSEYILGYYDEEDSLMAQVVVFPFQIYICEKLLNMGGVALVSSMPEIRHGGKIGLLLQEWLKIMRERNQYVSMLGPFSYEFYRKYGWELAFERKTYIIPIDLLSHFKNSGSLKKAEINDIPIIDKIYTGYAKSHNGCAVRDNLLWNDFTISHPWDDNYSRYTYIYKDDMGRERGYLIYKLKEEKIEIIEMIYEDNKALKGMLNFIYAHQSQAKEVVWSTAMDDKLPLLLTNQRIRVEINPGMMFRVVDVVQALRSRGYPESGRFSIGITDKYASWNEVTIDVDISEREVEIKECAYPQIKCDIQTFSQIFLGFITPMEAYNLGKLEAEDIEAVKEMNKIFKKSYTFNNNSF
ncbi:MAG: GNAT family N-acetyltransferase [Thermoanaerobacterium sp.]|nr:GNAT family N-acetyltransferase [Thermoanaerobacterium sp.]